MAFTSIPKDLNRIKSKVAFGMSKRQLLCFGSAATIGVPVYFLTRGLIGNSPAVLLMMVVMAPLFLLAMYEKDGLPAEKVLRNYIRTIFYWSATRPYKTGNFYNDFTTKGEVVTIAQSNKGTKQTPKPKHPSGKGNQKIRR